MLVSVVQQSDSVIHICTLFFYILFLNINLFNWRLITLKYFIGFAIHHHESTTGIQVFLIRTPLPPPSPYHSSGSFQCTSPKQPVPWIEPGLAIRFIYDIIHVSMLFSQIIPPYPSPTGSKRLFYTSVSLLLSCIQGYRYKRLLCSLSSPGTYWPYLENKHKGPACGYWNRSIDQELQACLGV